MTCTVRGSPDPTVTWFRRDKALTHDDTDVTIEREGNECSLTIGQCELLDEGNYSCVIQNELGQVTSSTKLVIQGMSAKLTLSILDSSISSKLAFLNIRKNYLLLIQCYYRRKPKINKLYLYWIGLSVLNCSSWRSSKDHLLLIQYYYRRKPKLN